MPTKGRKFSFHFVYFVFRTRVGRLLRTEYRHILKKFKFLVAKYTKDRLENILLILKCD